MMSGVDGVTDAAVQLPRSEPTIQIDVTSRAPLRYGLKPGDIRRSSAC